ncbi:hypothetical protein [Chlorogloeopsis sp. ULAP01]|uniref:hypothetical protein n=1 Tax=Chlorogloeopsis sp. ULAP01 TaxID=3056483 RepID=UPI0025ACB81A|nr:hypothetical protein [Chlorogloeopsis sp. ULAP01]
MRAEIEGYPVPVIRLALILGCHCPPDYTVRVIVVTPVVATSVNRYLFGLAYQSHLASSSFTTG